MHNILAIDPGKLSGWALYNQDTQHFSSGELEFIGIGRMLENLAPRGDLQTVVERFSIGTTTGKRPGANYPLEVIGLARYFSTKSGNPLKLQAPGDAKAFATNARLMAMGWWHQGGAGHANDAARHLMLYLVSTGWWDDRLFIEDDQ